MTKDELEQTFAQLEAIRMTARRKDWQEEPYTMEDAEADLVDISNNLTMLIGLRDTYATTDELEAVNAELLEALEAALPFVDYVHHYDQRRMTARESKSCKAAHKKMLYAIKHAKGD